MTDKAHELLELALKALEFDVSAKRTEEIKKEIRAHLAAEECPQNAEKATRSEDVVTEATDQEPDEDWDPPSFYELGKVRHTYTMVKQRKPLSEEEIDKAIMSDDGTYDFGFYDGVRFAEKHHGIGGGDE